MIRALIELIFAIVVMIAARGILTTVLKGLLTFQGPPQQRQDPAAAPPRDTMPPGRELHKDPVCGTYVPDSTTHRKQINGNTFYYCSEECLERHDSPVRR
jgi:YHS domain-containing protein